jgi:ABC transporter substrate binding protein
VDKIFKGAKPANLPVEEQIKMKLFINRRTAKALGVTIPQSLVISADKVIKYTVTACERPVRSELETTRRVACGRLRGPSPLNFIMPLNQRFDPTNSGGLRPPPLAAQAQR